MIATTSPGAAAPGEVVDIIIYYHRYCNYYHNNSIPDDIGKEAHRKRNQNRLAQNTGMPKHEKRDWRRKRNAKENYASCLLFVV